MLGSFYAPNLKIERARKHLADLEAEIAAFSATRPARFESAILPPEDGVQRVFFQMHFQQPWPTLGAIIGDVIHNLRTALDLAACDMVRWKEGETADVRKVYFPFCKSPDELDAMIRERHFHRAGEDAVALIREAKPYIGGNATLRAMHDLDIQDKHTALIPTFMQVGGPILSRWDDDGTPNLSFVGDPTMPSELKLVFPAGPFAGQEILVALEGCVGLTAGIVESFRALTATVK
jgi:hypothetical protein